MARALLHRFQQITFLTLKLPIPAMIIVQSIISMAIEWIIVPVLISSGDILTLEVTNVCNWRLFINFHQWKVWLDYVGSCVCSWWGGLEKVMKREKRNINDKGGGGVGDVRPVLIFVYVDVQMGCIVHWFDLVHSSPPPSSTNWAVVRRYNCSVVEAHCLSWQMMFS